jgi:hypothetical protein
MSGVAQEPATRQTHVKRNSERWQLPPLTRAQCRESGIQGKRIANASANQCLIQSVSSNRQKWAAIVPPIMSLWLGSGSMSVPRRL